jgi:hypothetical protein
MLVVTMAMMTTTLAKHTNEADNGDCEGDNDGDNDGEDDGDEDGNGCNRDDETNVDDVGVFKAFEDACSGWVGGRAIWAWGGSLRAWRTSRCRQIIAHVVFLHTEYQQDKAGGFVAIRKPRARHERQIAQGGIARGARTSSAEEAASRSATRHGREAGATTAGQQRAAAPNRKDGLTLRRTAGLSLAIAAGRDHAIDGGARNATGARHARPIMQRGMARGDKSRNGTRRTTHPHRV